VQLLPRPAVSLRPWPRQKPSLFTRWDAS
jgi:hypothetical protein